MQWVTSLQFQPVAILSIDVEKILIHIFVEIYGGDKIFQNIYFNSFLSFEPHDLCGHKVIKNLSFLKWRGRGFLEMTGVFVKIFYHCQSEALDNFPNLAASYSSLGADNI